MDKEMHLEEILEENELKNQQLQEEELRKELKNNKKKSEKLFRAIKQKEIEEKYKLAKYNAIESIKKIKQETEKQILMRRLMVKKHVNELRKKNERKKTEIKEQIFSIKDKMVEKLYKVTKKGNDLNCEYNNFDKEIIRINMYCEDNFKNDYNKLNDCRSEVNFCLICCENEFGDLYLTEREICYNKCKMNHRKLTLVIE